MDRIDEIRERYEKARRALTWRDVSEVDLSLEDIPYLLAEVDRLQNELSDAKSNFDAMADMYGTSTRAEKRLQSENVALRRERDAAVADIAVECYTCRDYKREYGKCVEVGDGLCVPKGRYSGWRWRGVAPESEG